MTATDYSTDMAEKTQATTRNRSDLDAAIERVAVELYEAHCAYSRGIRLPYFDRLEPKFQRLYRDHAKSVLAGLFGYLNSRAVSRSLRRVRDDLGLEDMDPFMAETIDKAGGLAIEAIFHERVIACDEQRRELQNVMRFQDAARRS